MKRYEFKVVIFTERTIDTYNIERALEIYGFKNYDVIKK